MKYSPEGISTKNGDSTFRKRESVTIIEINKIADLLFSFNSLVYSEIVDNKSIRINIWSVNEASSRAKTRHMDTPRSTGTSAFLVDSKFCWVIKSLFSQYLAKYFRNGLQSLQTI